MRSFIGALILAVLTFFSAPRAHAATQADVARVVMLVKKHRDRGGDYQMVFHNGGKKYTLWYAEGGTVAKVLSIWVKSAGGQEVNFSDRGTDGVVDFGVNGKRTQKVVEMQLCDSERQIGSEFCHYWQDQYDQAISAALASLARQK